MTNKEMLEQVRRSSDPEKAKQIQKGLELLKKLEETGLLKESRIAIRSTSDNIATRKVRGSKLSVHG